MDYLPRLMSPIYPHEQVVPDYMFTSSRTNLEKINPDLTSVQMNEGVTILINKYLFVCFQEKPAHIPDKSKPYKPRDPLEFVRNVWGKSS